MNIHERNKWHKSHTQYERFFKKFHDKKKKIYIYIYIYTIVQKQQTNFMQIRL